ncbi:hypothetical protein A4S06_02190 [Erysipelotrichaceae bacterium MTC7]|nr:hypothetical protein A4S06_02190 [Erysipelotrichaceae bacterium MTC7]
MKKNLREETRKKREELNELQLANYSLDVVDKLIPLLRKYEKIAIYLPMNSEVDVTSLLGLERSFFAPVVSGKREMDFYLIEGLDQFTIGAFGQKEPISDFKIAPEDLEVIIVPLVGFDANLNRLGQGGGYYDVYLKKTNALKIGVGFEAQKVADIPTEAFDVPLDYIVSEAKVYHR